MEALSTAPLLVALSLPLIAQNSTNYHVLHNGFDAVFVGIGAGTDGLMATRHDGLGYWIPGEDLRGACVSAQTGTFAWRMAASRETACLYTPGLDTTGQGLVLQLPLLTLMEVQGSPNCPSCFTNPYCETADPDAFLGEAKGYPSGCFAIAELPSAHASSCFVLVPNAMDASNLTVIATATDFVCDLPDASLGFCWIAEFTWVPSVALTDGIEGLWSYRKNSPDLNQYWGFSDDEVNLWNSNTVAVTDRLGTLVTFPASVDYAAHVAGRDAETSAALAPAGRHGTDNTFYDGPIPNGTGLDLNQGFDVGRGAHAISLQGHGGASDAANAFPSNQAIGNNTPQAVLPTLGFASWDNSKAPLGQMRVMFVSVDFDGFFCNDPFTLCPAPVKNGKRLPILVGTCYVPSAALSQLFVHTTAPGWPDPDGIDLGGGGHGAQQARTSPCFEPVDSIGGHSTHVPVNNVPVAVCFGVPLNLTYGSIPLKPNNTLDFTGTYGALSGMRELFLMD